MPLTTCVANAAGRKARQGNRRSCTVGEPAWHWRPTRRRFSFACLCLGRGASRHCIYPPLASANTGREASKHRIHLPLASANSGCEQAGIVFTRRWRLPTQAVRQANIVFTRRWRLPTQAVRQANIVFICRWRLPTQAASKQASYSPAVGVCQLRPRTSA